MTHARDAALDTFLGLRLNFPDGTEVQARKPLLWKPGLKLMEKLEDWTAGKTEHVSGGLEQIVLDLCQQVELDPAVFDGLTVGEVADQVKRFFYHRRGSSALPLVLGILGMPEPRPLPGPTPQPSSAAPAASPSSS